MNDDAVVYNAAFMAMTYRDLPGLMTLMTGDEKHSESATSTLDALWVLYDRVLRVDPENPTAEDRDRFLLSKGHGPIAFYAVLAAKGFISVEALSGFATYDSALGNHPDAALISGVEISSGSLGHGLPIAVGVALGLRAKNLQGPRVFCLVGDAELDEGSNHEAICLAGRMSLSAITVIAIDNQSSSYGWPGGIAKRFELEGWAGYEVDGRDHDAMENAMRGPNTAPSVVVLRVEPKS